MNTTNCKLLLLVFFSLLVTRAAAQKSTIDPLIKNKRPIPSALSLINALQPVSFTYDYQKIMSLPQERQFSVETAGVQDLAEELVLKKSYSYPVAKNATREIKVETVDLEKLVPFLIKAMQEQQQEIEEIKKVLAADRGDK